MDLERLRIAHCTTLWEGDSIPFSNSFPSGSMFLTSKVSSKNDAIAGSNGHRQTKRNKDCFVSIFQDIRKKFNLGKQQIGRKSWRQQAKPKLPSGCPLKATQMYSPRFVLFFSLLVEWNLIFHQMAHELGASAEWAFTDIWGLDDEVLAAQTSMFSAPGHHALLVQLL